MKMSSIVFTDEERLAARPMCSEYYEFKWFLTKLTRSSRACAHTIDYLDQSFGFAVAVVCDYLF